MKRPWSLMRWRPDSNATAQGSARHVPRLAGLAVVGLWFGLAVRAGLGPASPALHSRNVRTKRAC